MTIDDMAAHLLRAYPNSEASALRILENDYPTAAPADRAEAAKRHALKEGLGRQG
jgi:hypothetical protein